MKRSLLADICCPVCLGPLDVQATSTEDKQIVEGTLECPQCPATYPVHKKMPYLIYNEQLEETKAQEMKGWVSLWEKMGMYDNPTLEDSFRLPYVGHIWTDLARMFDMALQEMDLKGNETILDLGAGQGWAARYFAEKGCKVIATDIVGDEWYGLGRSWAIMEHANVYFEPLLTDGEKLPFPAETFDIVFFSGALHHFEKFDKVLKQVHRVLKHSGRLIAVGEPAINLLARERDVQSSLKETDEGIIERRPKVIEYWWAVKKAGFTNVNIDTFETYQTSPIEIYSWTIAMRNNLFNRVRTRYKPIVWSFYSLVLILPPRIAGQLVLNFNGGNLFIRAKK